MKDQIYEFKREILPLTVSSGQGKFKKQKCVYLYIHKPLLNIEYLVGPFDII